MKTHFEFISFADISDVTKKTSAWNCRNNHSETVLGRVQWHSPWRQYCYFPLCPAVYSKGCLEDINTFIKQLMDARK